MTSAIIYNEKHYNQEITLNVSEQNTLNLEFPNETC